MLGLVSQVYSTHLSEAVGKDDELSWGWGRERVLSFTLVRPV